MSAKFFHIENNVLLEYRGSDVHIIIPPEVRGIGDNAFTKQSIKSVHIHGGVKTIGQKAFYCCTDLEQVIIDNGVEIIKSRAFYSCRSLTGIEFPNSVIEIGESAFFNCTHLQTVIIGDGIKTIKSGTFYNCISLWNVFLGNGIEEIENSAFKECKKLKKVNSLRKVIKINAGAFEYRRVEGIEDAETLLRIQKQKEAEEAERYKRRKYTLLLKGFFAQENMRDFYRLFKNAQITTFKSQSDHLMINSNSISFFDSFFPSNAVIFLSLDNLSEKFLDGSRYKWILTEQGIYQRFWSAWGGDNYSGFLSWEQFLEEGTKITYDKNIVTLVNEENKKILKLICWNLRPDMIKKLASVLKELKEYLQLRREDSFI